MAANPYESPQQATTSDAGRGDLVCPQCGDPMQDGYIPTQGIYWRHKGQQSLLLMPSQILPGTRPKSFRASRKVAAWRCARCKLIVLRYGEPAS